MQVLRVRTYPDPLLRRVAPPVDTTKSGWLRGLDEFLGELVKALYMYDGAAIAAPQVAADLRIIIVDLRPDTAEGKRMQPLPLVMINPRIEATSADLETNTEGCLSFPGVFTPVPRHASVTASWIGKDGEPATQEFTGLQARAIQHEVEHLDGVLLIDHIKSGLKRDMVLRRMRRVNKLGGAKPKRRALP